MNKYLHTVASGWIFIHIGIKYIVQLLLHNGMAFVKKKYYWDLGIISELISQFSSTRHIEAM